jgi:molybdopterin-guanine dinucleotide biosynthesis protein A
VDALRRAGRAADGPRIRALGNLYRLAMVAPPAEFDALVLAGGAGSRMGGPDKPGQLIGQLSLLDHVLAAVSEARRTTVVGPPRSTARGVAWTRENPPGSGPVAALAAGLPLVTAERVVVLAADLPWIAPAVPALLDALGQADCAVLVTEGRTNYLAAAWNTAALRDALAKIVEPANSAMRRLYVAADVVEVPDPEAWGQDCDTWADLTAARRQAEQWSAR